MILPAPALMKRLTGKYWDFKKQLAFSFQLLAALKITTREQLANSS